MAFPRRRKSWEEGPGDTSTVQVTSTAATFLGSALSPTLDGITLLRLRGRFQGFLVSSSVASGGFTGAFGIGVATAAAVTAGAASVPTPITEQSWDGWIYWTPVQLTSGGIIAGGVTADHDEVNSTIAAMDIEVDTKAMRKLKEEDAIYAMVEFGTETGTAIADFRFDSRVLLALP